MEKIGTLCWLDQTGGKLAFFDRLRFTAQALFRRKLPIAPRRSVDEILPPDSPVVREAMKLCVGASEPWLVNHCLRSYFFARLLDDGAKKFDDEALFVGLLLHDLGLTEKHRLRGKDQQCFTSVGAKAAERLADRNGWSDKRALLVAQAISLHLNVTVGDEFGREAQLLRIGSGADVAGLGLRQLDREQIAAVVGKHPRLGLKDRLLEPLRIEVRERPDCRIAFLVRSLQFDEMILRAPQFAE
jgi:hypothetical protein